jgi:hypothetical protein
MQGAVITIAVKKTWIASINPTCVGNALTLPFVPTTY